jgi:uncharacterized LabA/DUF88 family protein
MNHPERITAYIDGANLYHGIKALGWKLDYGRFRTWLSEKYGVASAWIFIGLIPKNEPLYRYLQECGFHLAFKEVIYDGIGKPKGNCDADLILEIMKDVHDDAFDRCLIVSSDGDYSSLVRFLIRSDRLEGIISPANKDKCSVLLKRTAARIVYLNDQRSNLEKR